MPWITQRRVNWSQLSSKCNDANNNWHNRPLPLYPYKPFTFGSTLSQQLNMMYNPMTFGTRTEFQACGEGSQGLYMPWLHWVRMLSAFLMAMNFTFIEENYNGSTIRASPNPATHLECLKCNPHVYITHFYSSQYTKNYFIINFIFIIIYVHFYSKQPVLKEKSS